MSSNNSKSNLFNNESTKLLLDNNLRKNIIKQLLKFSEIISLFDLQIPSDEKRDLFDENIRFIKSLNDLQNTFDIQEPVIIKIEDESDDNELNGKTNELNSKTNELNGKINENKKQSFKTEDKSSKKEEDKLNECEQPKRSSRKRKLTTEKSAEILNEYSDYYEDEDDPDKLWCICRKPHSNRFMIKCCGCSEWFHCSCVGISKKSDYAKDIVQWFCKPCKN